MSETPNVLIVSDLHLSRGYYAPETDEKKGGRFADLEDFFADEQFFNFVAYHVAQGGRWRLILNGDVVDFLQVVDFPTDEETLAELRQVLHDTDDWETWKARKQKYGLGTTYIETRWKLEQIAAGHPAFFQALAYSLATGNEVIIIQGNHDVEWRWPQVQEWLRELVRQAYDPEQIERRLHERNLLWNRRKKNKTATLSDEALSQLQFCPRFYYVKGLMYVEHGCQYEVSNSFPDLFDPILPTDRDLAPEKQRIELPIGSFFVRYFFNHVEQATPFADNIKPIARYLGWVVRHHPAWVVKVLFTQGEIVRAIWKRLRQIHDNRVFKQGPLHAQVTSWPADYWHGPTPLPDAAGFLKGLRDLEERVFESRPPLLYVKPRYWLSAVWNDRPGYLVRAAQEIGELLRRQGEDVKYFVLGHDHNAEVKPLEGKRWYYNTGTWTPIEGERDRFFRETHEWTYVKIVPGAADEAQLLRWNDEGNRGERVILMTQSKEIKSGRKLWGFALLAGGLALLAVFLKRQKSKRS